MAPASKETEKKADEKVEEKKVEEEIVEVKPVPMSIEDGQSASPSPDYYSLIRVRCLRP